MRQPITTERRDEGLALVLPLVQSAYPGVEVDEDNVRSLVDGVADALEVKDLTTALVRGTRLLSVSELAQLTALLEGDE